MNFDGVTIGLLGLVLAGLGVIATFVAPRLVNGARLKFDLGVPSPLRHREEIGSLRISIFQNDQEVVGNVYLVEGALVNCGSKDISYQDFVDPVRLAPGPGIDVLSAEGYANAGIGEQVAVRDGNVFLDWRILKPKESVKLRLVIRSARPVEKRLSAPVLREEIRLKDVKSGEGIVSRYKLGRFFSLFIVLFASVNMINFIPPKVAAIVYESENAVRRIRISPTGNASCLVEPNMFYINECRSVNHVEISKALKSATFEEIHPGVRPLIIYLSALLSAAYAALILYGFGTATRMLARFRGGYRWSEEA